MVRGCLSNRACPAACDPRERGPPSDHCSGEDRARNCRCSLAGTNTSRWRPDRTSRTPWRLDRQMDRCRLEPAPIFRSLRRILRRRTCRLCPSRLPGARFCAPRATIAGAEGVRMLTRDFSCSQPRARDGCCIATMPPGAGLVWVICVDWLTFSRGLLDPRSPPSERTRRCSCLVPILFRSRR